MSGPPGRRLPPPADPPWRPELWQGPVRLADTTDPAEAARSDDLVRRLDRLQEQNASMTERLVALSDAPLPNRSGRSPETQYIPGLVRRAARVADSPRRSPSETDADGASRPGPPIVLDARLSEQALRPEAAEL